MADRSILVVDDNEINRGILGEIFKDQYNILEAGNGIEAMKSIEENEEKLVPVRGNYDRYGSSFVRMRKQRWKRWRKCSGRKSRPGS